MKIILPLLILSLVNLQINCDNASKVVEYAKSKVGCGYIWGTSGEMCTQSLINRKKGNGHVDPNIVKKWIGMQVFDCAGLVSSAFRQVGITMAKGATSAWGGTKWEVKGKISSLPKNKVCVLYKGDGNHMAHTGIYIGNDEYIHAAGSSKGVLKERMPGKWTHWGIPKGLYATQKEEQITPITGFPCQAKITPSSPDRKVNLRKSPAKNSSIVLRLKLGEIVTITGEENGWYKVSYKTAKGYIMKEFLRKA